MADVSKFKLGGADGNVLAHGRSCVKTFTTVIDIKKAVAEGLTAGDSYEIMTLPKGTTFVNLQAEILEALVLGSTPTTDIGTTKADPDEYVDAQTTITAGSIFTSTAGAKTIAPIASDLTLYAEFNGSGLVSGKVAVAVTLIHPTEETKEIAGPKVYKNT
jgi:hypothetical protein